MDKQKLCDSFSTSRISSPSASPCLVPTGNRSRARSPVVAPATSRTTAIDSTGTRPHQWPYLAPSSPKLAAPSPIPASSRSCFTGRSAQPNPPYALTLHAMCRKRSGRRLKFLAATTSAAKQQNSFDAQLPDLTHGFDVTRIYSSRGMASRTSAGQRSGQTVLMIVVPVKPRL